MRDSVDDVGFIDSVVAALITQGLAAEGAITATGFSNGGFMIYSLACYLSDKVAAFGPVAGLMYTEEYDNCTPQRPLPIVHIHGENDSSIPIDGSTYSVGFSTVLEYWSNYNQCTETVILDGADNNGDGYSYSATIKDECTDGVRLSYYRLGGTDHEWPNRDGLGYDYDIDAASTIWGFMKEFDINGAISE